MENRNLTISRQIWILSIIFSCLLFAVGLLGAWNATRLSDQLELVTKTYLKATNDIILLDMFHEGLASKVYKANEYSMAKNSVKLKELSDETTATVKRLNKVTEELDRLSITNLSKEKYQAAKITLSRYETVVENIVLAATSFNHDAIIAMLPEFEQLFKSLEISLETLSNQVEGDAEAVVNQSIATAESAKFWEYLFLAGGNIIGFSLAYFFVKGIFKHTSKVTSDLAGSSAALNESSRNIGEASNILAESTTELAAAIEQTAASMEQMGAMITQTSQNAEQTSTETSESLADAANGKLVVGKMVGSMKDIALSNNRLQSIAKVIEDIKNKTKIINDIAFETRLLAFNASIEAARAGAHGRGFAVVAEEVGKLANVSGKAADEVRTLLEDSVAQVGKIIEETKQKVDEGERTTQACESAFIKMESSFTRISHGIQRMAAATKEQESGVKQANRAISEMEKVTHANSRSAERLSSQSSHLKSASMGLLENAMEMQMLVFGRSGRSRQQSKNLFHPPNQGAGGGSGLGGPISYLKEGKDLKSNVDLSSGDPVANHQSTASDRSSEEPKDPNQVERSDSRWFAA